jgi:hypothetical protein
MDTETVLVPLRVWELDDLRAVKGVNVNDSLVGLVLSRKEAMSYLKLVGNQHLREALLAGLEVKGDSLRLTADERKLIRYFRQHPKSSVKVSRLRGVLQWETESPIAQ